VNRRCLRFILLLLIPMLATGCWDRTELSDLAFKMGLAMDKASDGQYIATAQIAVPSQLAGNPSGMGGGGQDKGYYVVSGVGQDTRDAILDMQNKLSRRVHAGQRRAIFVGERLAKEGMNTILDANTRDPETRLRTDLFIVKGGEGRDILNIYYPFERVPVMGTTKMHRVIGGTADTEFRDFLMDVFDDSTAPTLPVIEEYQDAEQQSGAFRFGGRAIFNKQERLIGYLNPDEGAYRSWIRGKLRYYVVTVPVPGPEGKARKTTKLRSTSV
jgi:spore germination protein KC